jgi:uncharacterized protein (TIGR02569 family)
VTPDEKAGPHDTMRCSPPPEEVLRAFGATRGAPLAGGQGTSWKAGSLVLKPVGDSVRQLEWLDSLPDTHSVRTARPVRAADGRLVVDGWSATPFLLGRHSPRSWGRIAAAGRMLSRELAGVSRAEWMTGRDDPWAVADRIAWGEEPLPGIAPGWLQAAASRRAEIGAEVTLIHGDLTGNILFEPGLPPAVIDLSPYFRPVEYAIAIVVVDAVCFEGAPTATRSLVRGADALQLVLRAILFRAVTDLLREGSARSERYRPALALLDQAV